MFTRQFSLSPGLDLKCCKKCFFFNSAYVSLQYLNVFAKQRKFPDFVSSKGCSECKKSTFPFVVSLLLTGSSRSCENIRVQVCAHFISHVNFQDTEY